MALKILMSWSRWSYEMTDRSPNPGEPSPSQGVCDHCGSGAVFSTPDGLLCAKHALELIDGRDDWIPLLRTPDGHQDRLKGEREPG